MKIKHLIIIALSLLASLSCKKESESSPSNALTSKFWKRALNDNNPLTNPSGAAIYYSVQNCEKDDSFRFGLDGNVALNRNIEKCDPNELQSETLTYTLNRTTKELDINGTKFTLAEESTSQIKYYATIPSNTGFQNLIFLLQ